MILHWFLGTFYWLRLQQLIGRGEHSSCLMVQEEIWAAVSGYIKREYASNTGESRHVVLCFGFAYRASRGTHWGCAWSLSRSVVWSWQMRLLSLLCDAEFTEGAELVRICPTTCLYPLPFLRTSFFSSPAFLGFVCAVSFFSRVIALFVQGCAEERDVERSTASPAA